MKKLLKFITYIFIILVMFVATSCLEPVPNTDKYTVTFKDYDGTILREEIIQHGHSATAPTNPTRDGYIFIGWDNEYVNIQKDTVIIALYEQNQEEIKEYTVQFLDYNGNILKEEKVKEGQDAIAPANPTRDGYNFIGWSIDYTNVKTDLTIIAQYEIVNQDIDVKKYTVTFDTNSDTIIEPQIVEKGNKVIEPIIPVKQGYDFEGWYLNDEKWSFVGYIVTDDIVLTAKWQIKQYTISFVDTDGTLLFDITQDYNTPVEITENPIKDYCNFIGWDQELPVRMPSENLTIEAKWYDLREDYILDGEKIVKCISDKTNLIVPSSYYLENELIQITKIGYASFIECGNLEEVTLEEGIKFIDEYSFQYLNIKKVNLPNSIEIISNYAFTNCANLTNINIPNNVINVEPSAFENCPNVEYYRSENGNYLGNEENNYLVLVSLIDLNVTTFEIKDETKFFLSNVFYYCYNLEYTEYENGLYLGSKTNPYKAFIKLKDVSVSTFVMNEKTEYVMDAAFYNNIYIENVTFSNNVKYIANYAFRGCSNLTNVILPEKLVYLGEWAFIYCSSITEITIPKNVVKVCESSLEACDSLQKISVHTNNKYFKAIDNILYTIDEKTLVQYALANEQNEIKISDNVERIGMYAFMNASNMKTLRIGKNVSKIYGSAFINCSSLENIIVDINNINYKTVDGILYTIDGKTLILYPMSKDNITFNVPSGVENIGSRAFSGNYYIQEVKLPDTVKTIEGRAFYQCYNLMQINIPITVNKIADYAFALSYNLVIKCEVETQPETWASTWNQNTAQTVWGYIE